MSWGIFDSGVGGLTVVRALQEVLPDTPLVYFGDTARVPYGIRSRETVREYAEEAARFMSGAGVAGLIVACNTASAVALDVVQETFAGPVLGVVEPGVRAALAASAGGKIGVLGTHATIRSGAYSEGLRRLRSDVEVTAQACPLFVPLAEEGWTEGDVPLMVAKRYLAPLLDARVDTVVLGCTHYPLLKAVVGEVMGPEVVLVDSAESVAAEATRLQAAPGWGAGARGASASRFCVSDAGGRFREVAARFLGREIGQLEVVRL